MNPKTGQRIKADLDTLSYGQITEILQRNSDKLHPAYLHLKTTGIQKSRYLHSDATGTKRKQQAAQKIIRQHLHFLGRRGWKKLYVSDDGSPNGQKPRKSNSAGYMK